MGSRKLGCGQGQQGSGQSTRGNAVGQDERVRKGGSQGKPSQMNTAWAASDLKHRLEAGTRRERGKTQGGRAVVLRVVVGGEGKVHRSANVG